MTWEIALGIFALVSFVIGILTYNRNTQKEREEILQTLTKLNATVENLNLTIEKFQTSSDKTHEQLFSKVNAQAAELAEFKAKISILERKIQ